MRVKTLWSNVEAIAGVIDGEAVATTEFRRECVKTARIYGEALRSMADGLFEDQMEQYRKLNGPPPTVVGQLFAGMALRSVSDQLRLFAVLVDNGMSPANAVRNAFDWE